MAKFILFPFFSLFFAWNVQADRLKIPVGMILIPEGTYEMGSRKSAAELNIMDILNPDRHALGPENPAHPVYIDAFYIDIYEVTNEDYRKYVEATKARKPGFWEIADFNGPERPVVGVSWKEASTYCQWYKKYWYPHIRV